MKKTLLLFCIVAIVNQAHAFTTQGNWRWRKDDGTQTTATYLAAENTTPVITTSDNVRLRIELYNTTGSDQDIKNTTLAYSLTGADNSWVLISDTVTNKDFVLSKSPFVTNLEATTQLLTARSGFAFKSGLLIDTVSTFPYTLSDSVSTEFEWVIKPTSTAKLNTTYYFESSVGGYDKPLPTLTIGSVLAVNLGNFSVTQQGGKALIKWSTSNESNNDHFDVLRSSDGQKWQTIATVKAKGNNGTSQTNYEATDNNPVNGNSYYRLNQYDKDGKSTLSAIRQFSIQLNKVIASVYPNPTASAINIQVQNYTGTVTAMLTNAQGTVVAKQTIAANASATSYKLNTNAKLPAGAYYLTLSGTNLSQKLKVIVQ